MRSPRVHLLAGLNGSGKTTYARRLQVELPAVRFTQDEWMVRLCQLSYDDPGYAGVVRLCREQIWETALQVLSVGTDVVLDWNSWSRAQRAEWAAKARDHGYLAVVHYLNVPLETAIGRAELRAASNTPGAYALTATEVRHLQTIFEEPGPGEGIELRVVDNW
jgi:predicted kinase